VDPKYNPNNARGGWSRILHSGKWHMGKKECNNERYDARKKFIGDH
jgi:hypothetical protein